MKMFEERFNHYTALKRHTDKNLKSHDIEPLIQINYTSNRLTTTFKDISNNESSTSEENLGMIFLLYSWYYLKLLQYSKSFK